MIAQTVAAEWARFLEAQGWAATQPRKTLRQLREAFYAGACYGWLSVDGPNEAAVGTELKAFVKRRVKETKP